MAGPSASASTTPTRAQAQAAVPPAPPVYVETDAATLIQERLDKLMLACFNALLDVSKAAAPGPAAAVAAGGGAGGGEAASSQQVAQAAQTGVAIGRMLRELGEAVDALPVLPPPEEPGQTSVETARRRLKALEGEYQLIHQELVEAVEEAGVLSARLRKAISSSSSEGAGGAGAE